MKLRELFEAVKDKTLSREQIEAYRDELIHLHSAMQLEVADLEKAQAFYFMDAMNDDTSNISIQWTWKATEKGQRLIELNRYIKATVKEVDSLKSRVYSLL